LVIGNDSATILGTYADGCSGGAAPLVNNSKLVAEVIFPVDEDDEGG